MLLICSIYSTSHLCINALIYHVVQYFKEMKTFFWKYEVRLYPPFAKSKIKICQYVFFSPQPVIQEVVCGHVQSLPLPTDVLYKGIYRTRFAMYGKVKVVFRMRLSRTASKQTHLACQWQCILMAILTNSWKTCLLFAMILLLILQIGFTDDLIHLIVSALKRNALQCTNKKKEN